jgi:bifunctional non-homologous end joining protein LigD
LPRRSSTHKSQARFIARVIEGAEVASAPGFIEPCMPTLRKVPPKGDGWLHEIKYDGYRAQVQFDKRPRIYTRRGHDWADRMPVLTHAISALPANQIVLDGEIVALDKKGMPSFPGIATELTKRGAKIIYVTFDLLYLDGFDLRGAALSERKRVLREFMKSVFSERIRYCDHVDGDGAVVLEAACKLGLEGIVSKRANAPYRSGKRPEWIKTKCAAWREANRDRGQLFAKAR